MTALEALALKQQEQLAAAYQQAYALEMFRANLFAVLSPRTTRLLEVLNARAEKLRSELYARPRAPWADPLSLADRSFVILQENVDRATFAQQYPGPKIGQTINVRKPLRFHRNAFAFVTDPSPVSGGSTPRVP